MLTVYVEGTARGNGGAASPIALSSMAHSSIAGSSGSSGIPVASKTRGFSLKIIKATKTISSNGKVELVPEETGYVSINAATADVEHIAEMIQKKWGKGYQLVGNDGLPIGDCSGTRGMQFWKVGSRKLFAVKGPQKGHNKKRKRRQSESADSAEEDVLIDLHREIKAIRVDVMKILDTKSRMHWPVGLITLLYETFKCSICHSSIQPPAIFARCCRSIVGCQACVDRWYRGEGGVERKCPLCRGDRGYADTCKMVCLDAFLREINGLVAPPPLPNDESAAQD